jgi:hypothetical protein
MFIIFSTYYFDRSQEIKQNYTFYPEIMRYIYNSFTQIENSNSDQYKEFIETFKQFFPTTHIDSPDMIGGYQPYNRYQPYNQQHQQQYRQIKQKETPHIAYYITIDLDLKPGTSLTPEELKGIGCVKKWNSIKKAYSDFRGKPKTVMPNYHLINKPNNKTNKNTSKNTSKKANIRGGLKNKTLKKDK